MKTPNEQKQKAEETEKQIAKEIKNSGCCGPTCCGGSNDKKNKNREEK